MPVNCPFCGFDEPAVTLFGDDDAIAIVSRSPINRYHVLIVPRVHVERLTDLPERVAVAVMRAAQRAGRAVGRMPGVDGIVYVTEDDLAGVGYNLVPHFKLHVIARRRGDDVRMEWNRTPDPGPEARGVIADELRSRLEA